MATLSPDQLRALSITERVNSAVSVAGIVFVVLTYMYSPRFNKPINRLIFFASWGNLGSNIAALISELGPAAGTSSALCQFQAFLVQMFLGVDCYWALCMAVNVYLVFFRDYTVDQLRSLDILYLLICYGLAFIPAVVFIFISTPERGRMYGPAIIWCWVTEEWDFMRVVFLYGIVWVAIVVAFIVYGMAAKVIWDKREHLDGFLNPLNENPFVNTITTEIEVTYEENTMINNTDPPKPFNNAESDNYSVHIRVDSQNQNRPLPAALRMRSITKNVAKNSTNAEAWLYARVAFLFFIALLITWIPSSVNRMYSLVLPNVINYPLNYVASFVFPLQAFWNTIVYILTSQTACRELFSGLFRSSTSRTGNNDIYSSRGQQRLDSFSGRSDDANEIQELRVLSMKKNTNTSTTSRGEM